MPRLPVASAAIPGQELRTPDDLLRRAGAAELAGRWNEAIELYRRVLAIDPNCLHAINRLGAAAGETGDLSTAVRHFLNSARIDPNQSEVWFNLGVAQSRLGRTQDALTSFDGSIALSPGFAAGHLQRAATLARLGRYREAVAGLEETSRLSPNDATTAVHHGLALQWCGQYDQALNKFDRAISLDPDFAEAWVSKAMLLMMLGDLANGLPLYERRWRMTARLAPASGPGHTRPLWLGQSGIAGKTILIYKEQGLGDAIQFCRYATMAANAGARVIVQVQPTLTALMATLPGVWRVVSEAEPPPDHDLRCPMMSLPLAFGTTVENIPGDVPYLRADPSCAAVWRQRLAGLRGRRIGLVWHAGSRAGDSELVALEQRKSIPLQALAPLGSVAGCEFVSIQLGPEAARAAPPELRLHDYTSHLNDCADTAGLMDNLDLIISVCTSTAHLAGAMGKPIWLLNRFDTDWRWFLDREDSPWYPTMRIFRQPSPGDWTSVIQAVAGALPAFAAA
jgi:tetratricopeptide (TPR) repeat protein